MKTTQRTIAALSGIFALFLCGCATNHGPKLNQAAVDSITKGKTTKAELIARFGNPAHSTSGPLGVEYLLWSSFQSNISASNFIPVVGSFVGKTETKGGSLRVTLDQNKVVQDYSFSSSGYSNR